MLRRTINGALEKLTPSALVCQLAADNLRREHPGESTLQLARRAIQLARRSAATAGAATGVIANPLVMAPAALADMAAVLRIEGTLAGTLAALFDPASLTDQSLRADVVSIMFPGAVSQALRQVGIRVGDRLGQRLTQNVVREYLGRDLAQSALRLAARHFGVELTRKAILEKTAPLIGAGIGAGWNWLEVGAVGKRALRYYAGESIEPPRKGRLRLPLGDASPIRAWADRMKRRLQGAAAPPLPPPTLAATQPVLPTASEPGEK